MPFLYADYGMFIEKGELNKASLKARGENFNRVQRGHQHLLELQSDAYALLFLAAILFPLSAAKAGALYALGSLVYGLGYGIGSKYRLVGEAIYYPGIFWLLYLVGYTGYTLITN